ncbi:MAG: hypothetical protein V4754_03905 [Pseudomonadota bacterium]
MVFLLRMHMPPPRPLTRGEIDMAALVFGAAIDYARVRIHCRSYLWFGLQDRHTVMAPNGAIYCMPPQYRADFSCQDARTRLLFMHEMVHVWQHQRGYRLRWHGLCLALGGAYASGRAYRYDARLSEPDRAFSDFNMEQQAEIVTHYFGARHLGLRAHVDSLGALERVLTPFLRDARDPALLPKPWFARRLTT